MKTIIFSFIFLFAPMIYLQSARAEQTNSLHFKKVVWMVFENADAQTAAKQADFKQLTTYGASLTKMSGESHPSLPNYIAMIAGSTMGIKNDQSVSLNGSHLGDLLEKAGMKWKVYAEDYPGDCFLGASSGHYARRHVPFLSFANVTNNLRRCQNIQSTAKFEQDYKDGILPEFSMYIPNTNNDGHDTNVSVGGKWLISNFGKILSRPEDMKDTLFIITFDEADESSNNSIYTVLIGDHVQPGSKNSQALNHISLLKMIEDEFKIGNLGREDAKAKVPEQIWK